MSTRHYYEFNDPQQAHKAVSHLWQFVKASLIAGHKLCATVGPMKRSDAQNAHYHALIAQIAAQSKGRDGDELAELVDPEDAKRILISAFRIDTRNDPDLADEWARVGDMRIGRGLRGETVLLGLQSRRFTVKLAIAFIDWLYAFGAEYDMVLHSPGEGHA